MERFFALVNSPGGCKVYFLLSKLEISCAEMIPVGNIKESFFFSASLFSCPKVNCSSPQACYSSYVPVSILTSPSS
jgi:hypothetical protein